ncbi:MAG: hypothetical protein C5B51_05205 [Terriglobia bacterium]|nr:MAG: hypothetical protein C5B51_05205 [Terriglobia bacterium]
MIRKTPLLPLGLVLLLAGRAAAQSPCSNTPAYSPCELVFELSEQDASVHPNPYLSVELRAEFRSPRHRTFLAPAFWDGGRKLVIRFTPTEAGDWDYRLTSNIASWDGKSGAFAAAASEAPGFLRAANVHHWAYTERNVPHLWMGATELNLAGLDDAAFRAAADARAVQKFNHLRLLLGADSGFSSADQPDFARLRRLDERLRYLNQKGIVADLVLAGVAGQLTKSFPSWEQRRRFIRYVVARYAPFNVTWQVVPYFEDYPDGRALMTEIGRVLQESDPYQHPRTAGAHTSSATLLEDKWMSYAAYETADDAVGSIEHQLFAVPFVNFNVGGAQGESFRRRLWNATMDGQYVAVAAGAADAKAMTVWFDILSDTRHWELEPYFDVDGGRAVALEGIEYLVYVEKPGPLELLVEKHGYDVLWINPATGETTRQKFKGDHFTGEAPDKSHDWVLHVVREGRVESMNKSYKFESREIGLQEIEQNSAKVPFEVEQPAADIVVGQPISFSAKIKRETRATRSMMWLWTGEVAADGQGYRVLGAAQKGNFTVPAGLARNYPAVMNLRVYGMNANGKVYALDRALQLTR